MAKNHCYWNGKITTLDRIRISPYDIGMLRGYGVFDVMAANGQKPFLIKEHFERLTNSAKELKLPLPFTFPEYEKILEKLLSLHKNKKSTIRTILTGGISSDAFSIGRPTCYILIEKFHDYPKEVYQKGVRLITHEFERMIPKSKVTNYVEAIKLQDKKNQAKALEILFVKEGKVLEASTSNIFLVKDGKIITPKDRILLGITRNLMVRLAKKDYPVEEREVTSEELKKADEIFLTATNKFVVPVVRIDSWKVGSGRVGEVTRKMMDKFSEFEKEN